MRQDVWSKRTWQASEKELEQRKALTEASKPTVNTPEQAKELERQALEKNPVTKLSHEQAQELNEQSKLVVYTKEQAAKLEKQALDKSIQSGILGLNGNRINIGMQFFSKSIEDFATIILPKDEYAHVMGEIATNITEEQNASNVFIKYCGNYQYVVENRGFGNYRVISRRIIK